MNTSPSRYNILYAPVLQLSPGMLPREGVSPNILHLPHGLLIGKSVPPRQPQRRKGCRSRHPSPAHNNKGKMVALVARLHGLKYQGNGTGIYVGIVFYWNAKEWDSISVRIYIQIVRHSYNSLGPTQLIVGSKLVCPPAFAIQFPDHFGPAQDSILPDQGRPSHQYPQWEDPIFQEYF